MEVVRPMLYGFGDGENPRQDTVELVEEMVVDYITQIVSACHFELTAPNLKVTEAVRLAQSTSLGTLPAVPVATVKLRTDDLLHVLRHDPKKLARVEELLYMNEELKRARKAFDIEEEVGAKDT